MEREGGEMGGGRRGEGGGTRMGDTDVLRMSNESESIR